MWINWTELNWTSHLASSNYNSFSNGYTDREESVNEKRRKKKEEELPSLLLPVLSPFSHPRDPKPGSGALPAEEAMSEQTNNLNDDRWVVGTT